MEKIDKAIEILQAFDRGDTIEYFGGSGWIKYYKGSSPSVLLVDLGKSPIEHFRIAKQLTYRPYANAEEFLKASKEHGPYFKDDTNCLFLPIYIANEYVETKEWKISYKQMSKDCVTVWQDGTPCGILEE